MDPNIFWVALVALFLGGEYLARHKSDRFQFLTYWIRRIPFAGRLALLALAALHFLPLCGGDYCL